MKPLAKLLAAILLIVSAQSTRATVLLELAGAFLKDQSLTPVTYGSGLLVLVASTADADFATITSASNLVVGSATTTGGDDIVIYKSSISGDGNLDGTEDAGEFRQAISVALADGLAAGNPVTLYWFPTLTTESTQVGGGTRFGVYRSIIASDATEDADGSAPWVLPADGTSGHTLLFLTSDAGSSINTGTSGAQYGQTEGATENHAPVANDDTVNITKKTVLNLLSNDTDEDGDTLTITAITQPTKGVAALSNDGVVTYTPGASFDGEDAFSYTISDRSGGTATANVTVLNRFLAVRGTYSAVVSLNGTAAGKVTATVTGSGLVTGRLVLDGKTYKIRGTASADGVFTRTLGNGTVASLTFATNANDYATVSGTVTNATGTYTLSTTAAFATAALANAPVGRYNCLLPGSSEADQPAGTGWCTIVLGKKATLRGLGRLPDNTAVSFSTQLRMDGSAGFSRAVYAAPAGSFSGTLAFAASSGTDVTGTFSLVKPARKKTTGLFAAGFTLTGTLTGEIYTAPATGVQPLTFASSSEAIADAGFVDGDLALGLTQAVSFAANSKATSVTPINFPLTLRIIRATGLMKGAFTPTGGSHTTFTGVTLQKTNAAAGVFAGANQTGTASLIPPE